MRYHFIRYFVTLSNTEAKYVAATEAKYVAATEAAKEMIWLHSFFDKVGKK